MSPANSPGDGKSPIHKHQWGCLELSSTPLVGAAGGRLMEEIVMVSQQEGHFALFLSFPEVAPILTMHT